MGEIERITLELDREDYDTIMEEIENRKNNTVTPGEMLLPDGESNEFGAVLAECVRDLNEYRGLYKADHPVKPSVEGTVD